MDYKTGWSAKTFFALRHPESNQNTQPTLLGAVVVPKVLFVSQRIRHLVSAFIQSALTTSAHIHTCKLICNRHTDLPVNQTTTLETLLERYTHRITLMMTSVPRAEREPACRPV